MCFLCHLTLCPDPYYIWVKISILLSSVVCGCSHSEGKYAICLASRVYEFKLYMITFDFKICKTKCIHSLIFALFSRGKVKSLNEAREMAHREHLWPFQRTQVWLPEQTW